MGNYVFEPLEDKIYTLDDFIKIAEKVFKDDKTMENKSLSARIKRRNAKGFAGVGTPAWTKRTSYGDYRNIADSNKQHDIDLANARKSKLGVNPTGPSYHIDAMGQLHYFRRSKNRQFCKKYADNRQAV